MHQALTRKLVAYTRATLPPSRRKRILRRTSKAIVTASNGVVAGIFADVLVRQHAPSIFDVDQEARETFVTTILYYAAARFL